MGFTAIGVHILPTVEERFRIRVKQPGDHAWRTTAIDDCCADDACRALVELGLTPERALQLLNAARAHGVSSDSQRIPQPA